MTLTNYRIVRETDFGKYETKNKKEATEKVKKLNLEEKSKAKKMGWKLIDKWIITTKPKAL